MAEIATSWIQGRCLANLDGGTEYPVTEFKVLIAVTYLPLL
jgi:hypothetical protein